jgi:DGQHR domain-containing protein
MIPNRPDSGWVIDGQHRLAGATNSDVDIELAVVAFLDLDLDRQIFQFVTINKTAKGVPTSLYYDLLRHLPPSKTPAEKAREKSADIAQQLTRDEESPLFNRITVSSPRPGQSLSLNNFVRKVAPLIQDDPARSPISTFNVTEQTKIIDNYFRGLREYDPQLFRYSPTVVFRTLGFGALLNALSTIFSLTLTHHKGFRVEDVASVFSRIDFDFTAWEGAGSGNAAELQAGKDLEESARYAYSTESGVSVIKL